MAAGLDVTEVADYTGQPEVFGGRVKTLHPKIHGGILARRDEPEDVATLERHGFLPIDLVVVNLYPFEATVARPDATWAEAIENIDIGGPALIRAAAKNHAHVAVLTSPEQYAGVIAAVQDQGGTSLEDRRRLALAAFRATGAYDQAITDLPRPGRRHGGRDPALFRNGLTCVSVCGSRCGTVKTPTRQAAFYVEPAAAGSTWRQRSFGTARSSPTIISWTSTVRCDWSASSPSRRRVSSSTTTLVAPPSPPDLAGAFERAYEGDPVSAFGGIVGLNRPVDRPTAERMCQPGRFLEAILAPGFDDDALEWLRTKPSWRNSVRLLDLGPRSGPACPRLRVSTFAASREACWSRTGTGSSPTRPRAGRHPAAAHRGRVA